jgi:mRNA interferase RelE/StbE
LPVRIEYKASVERDLRRIDPAAAVRIVDRIEQVLASPAPRLEPLHGALAGLFKLRVGEYRVICERIAGGFLVLRVGHRRDVYRG